MESKPARAPETNYPIPTELEYWKWGDEKLPAAFIEPANEVWTR
jgi:hypothetical protein